MESKSSKFWENERPSIEMLNIICKSSYHRNKTNDAPLNSEDAKKKKKKKVYWIQRVIKLGLHKNESFFMSRAEFLVAWAAICRTVKVSGCRTNPPSFTPEKKSADAFQRETKVIRFPPSMLGLLLQANTAEFLPAILGRWKSDPPTEKYKEQTQ